MSNYGMYGISFLTWIYLFGILIPDSLSKHERSSVTFDKCRLQGLVSRSHFISLICVNDTLKERRQSIENGQLMCNIAIDSDKKDQKRFVVLDMFLNGDPPSKLSLQIADKFLPDLQYSTIVCSYTDIGSRSRINNTMLVKSLNSAENGTYVCDQMESQVIFTGVPVEVLPDFKQEMSKRSVVRIETPVPEIKCFNSTRESDKHFKLQGDLCKVDHDIAFRWMFNSSGLPDCLTCCKDHYYDDETHQGCEKCSPGTTQPKRNVWPHCEPAYEHRSTTHPTKPKPGISSPTPTPMPMSPVSSTQSPSSKLVETTDPEPKIRSPAEAPTGVVVTKAGYDHALIKWDATPSRENAPVFFYKVTIENLVRKEEREFSVERSKTTVKLTDLVSGSCYEAKVQAGNYAGYGPMSNSINVYTLRVLAKLQDIHYKNEDGLVTVTWPTEPEDRDATAKVEYWPTYSHSGTVQTKTKSYSNGEIDFHLPFHVMFTVRVFYKNEADDGPKSEIKVEHKEKLSVFHYIGYAVAILVLVIGAIGLIWDSIKDLIDRICYHQTALHYYF